MMMLVLLTLLMTVNWLTRRMPTMMNVVPLLCRLLEPLLIWVCFFDATARLPAV